MSRHRLNVAWRPTGASPMPTTASRPGAAADLRADPVPGGDEGPPPCASWTVARVRTATGPGTRRVGARQLRRRRHILATCRDHPTLGAGPCRPRRHRPSAGPSANGTGSRRARRRPPTWRRPRCGGDRCRARCRDRGRCRGGARSAGRPCAAGAAGRWRDGPAPARACPGRSRTRWNDATRCRASPAMLAGAPVIDGNRAGRGPHGRRRLPAGLGAGGRARRPGAGRGHPGGRRSQPRLLELQGGAGSPGRRPRLRGRRRQGRARRAASASCSAGRGGSATSAWRRRWWGTPGPCSRGSAADGRC